MNTFTAIAKNTVKSAALALCGAAAFLSAAPAQGQLASFVLLDDSTQLSNVMVTNQGALHGDDFDYYYSVSAGRYKATLDGQLNNVWCIDLNHPVQFGDGYTANIAFTMTDDAGSLSGGYYQGGAASAIGNGDFTPDGDPNGTGAIFRAAAAGWLSDTYSNANAFANIYSSDTVTNLTAIQLALWDMIQDGGDGMAAGTFRLAVETGDRAAYGDLVAFYNAQASAAATGYSASSLFIQAPVTVSGSTYTHKQMFTGQQTAVPEPGTWALLAGTAAFGANLFRRRRAARK